MSQNTATGVSLSFEPEYCELRGKLCINRLTKASSLNEHVFKRTEQPVLRQQIGDKRLALGIRAPGLLDTIQYSEEETPKLPPGPDEVDVEVWAIGVNFKDCLGLLGRVNTAEYGTECVGIVKKVGAGITEFKVGDRVASGEPNCFKTWIRSHVNNVVKLPESMPFAEAGAIPTQFLTAYHSIMYVARARKGQTILVHSAAGGTGQAMVQVAQYVGAEVFCTVGSAAKKKLLQEVYDIPEDHIFFSRDTSFADGIKRMTGGRGVDIVINSLSGPLLKATWECIAAFGHFIDIGLKDAFMGNDLPMRAFANNATFSGVNLAPLCQSRDGHNKKAMQEVLDLFEKGVFKIAYPLQIYPLEETEKAFRFLATGQSSGKMVITVDRKATLPVVQHSASDFHFDDNSTYVIAGGLGGIGRKMARWLVKRGARNLMLLSRSGPHGNLHAEAMLAEFKEMGVNVQCPVCDITDLTSLKDALMDCLKTMPPIRGCIQAAMALSDTTFTDMNIHQWRQATRPKIQGSWNLHLALPSGMDFFVLLSSCCGVCGNGGQSNYAAGNTYQDALAGYRTSIGEKTISLDIGVVRGEGFFEHNQQLMDRLLRLDMLSPTSDNEIFAIMDYYCNPLQSNIDPFQSQAIMGFNLPADIEAKGKDIPTPMHQPLFRYMLQSPGSSTRSDASKTSKQSFKTTFVNATTAAEGALIAAEAMREKLSKMLGLQPENLGLDESLTTFGADSLVGLELRNWLAKEAGADVAVFEILGDVSLRSVGELVALRTSFRPEGWTKE